MVITTPVGAFPELIGQGACVSSRKLHRRSQMMGSVLASFIPENHELRGQIISGSGLEDHAQPVCLPLCFAFRIEANAWSALK